MAKDKKEDGGKKSAKTTGKSSNGEATSFADTRTRAVGLLLEYLDCRCGIDHGDVEKRFKGGGVNKSQLDKARRGQRSLPDDAFGRLVKYLAEALTENISTVRHDVAFLMPLLIETGIELEMPAGFRDQRASDFAFLESMNIPFSLASHEGNQAELHNQIGGIWCLIRPDTASGPAISMPSAPAQDAKDERPEGPPDVVNRYSLSLLNVKPQRYFALTEPGDGYLVRTANLHFSVRSPGKNTHPNLFHGQIIKEKKEELIHLVGSQEWFDRPIVMALGWLAAPQGHVPFLQGTIQTVNRNYDTVSTPVAAFFIPDARRGDGGLFNGLTQDQMDEWRAQAVAWKERNASIVEVTSRTFHAIEDIFVESSRYKHRLHVLTDLVGDGSRDEIFERLAAVCSKLGLDEETTARLTTSMTAQLRHLNEAARAGADNGYFVAKQPGS